MAVLIRRPGHGGELSVLGAAYQSVIPKMRVGDLEHSRAALYYFGFGIFVQRSLATLQNLDEDSARTGTSIFKPSDVLLNHI